MSSRTAVLKWEPLKGMLIASLQNNMFNRCFNAQLHGKPPYPRPQKCETLRAWVTLKALVLFFPHFFPHSVLCNSKVWFSHNRALGPFAMSWAH